MSNDKIDLANAKWRAIYKDGTIEEKYSEINRNKLKSFEIHFKNPNAIIRKNHVITVEIKGKTLVHRLRSKGSGKLGAKIKQDKLEQVEKISVPLEISRRIRIIALLQKNTNHSKNKKYIITENKKIVQEYYFDPSLSEIYYIYEDGKIETKNNFGIDSPYHPIKLREEEMLHLNG